jgi:chromosome segregation ATPase
LCFFYRAKISQSKLINELKKKLEPKEKELGILHNRSNELDAELKKSKQQNDNLRVKVENIEQKLKSTKKVLASKTKQVKDKAEEVMDLECKLQNLCNYVNDFNELKKHLIALSHEYMGSSQPKLRSKNGLSLSERKSDMLQKKIKSKQEILERNKTLHQTRVRKLKRDQMILKAVSE